MGKSAAVRPSRGRQAAPSTTGAFGQELGARLRALRTERGWSQRELGRRLGVLQSKLSKYESGTHQPSLRTLVRIASLYEVSTDYLLTGAELPAPPLRDGRLLDRFRRLGAAGEELRLIVLSILDALFALDAHQRQLPNGDDAAPAVPDQAWARRPAVAASSRPVAGRSRPARSARPVRSA
jgi:transcriptional regulator with XRE-family HTH domain